MNPVTEIIQKRRSVRKFNGVPVSKETLQKIVEAGRWAPSGGNCQTTHFTVVTNAQILEELRKLVQNAFAAMEMRDDLYRSLKNSIKLSKAGIYAYDYKAPVLVIVSNEKGYSNAIADSACAIQNMMLAATSFEIGSCWINQLHWLDENKAVRAFLEKLGILENETICGSMALGYFDGDWVFKPRVGMKVDYII